MRWPSRGTPSGNHTSSAARRRSTAGTCAAPSWPGARGTRPRWPAPPGGGGGARGGGAGRAPPGAGRGGYAAALPSRHWEGLIAVGDVYLRIGDAGAFRAAARTKARKIYRAALLRARDSASVAGVLRTAAG